jgi:hypothetical protein
LIVNNLIFNKVIINKNIPKNHKQIKFTLSSSKLSPKIYNNSSGLTANNSIVVENDDNDDIVIEDDDNDDDNEIDWDLINKIL